MRRALVLVAAAGCPRAAAPCPPIDHASTEAAVLHSDDSAAPRLDAAALAIALDPAHPGRVELTVSFHGAGAIEVALPARPDQIEWFDPGRTVLAIATPRVMWTVWHPATGALATDSRPSASRQADAVVTLHPDETRAAIVELGAAHQLPAGWCARAWLVGGPHPMPSNVVCVSE